MNKALMIAAIMSAGTAGIHFFAGGADVAGPLLAAPELAAEVKFTSYYCWHMVSLLLVAMSLGFGYAARSGEPGRPLVLMLLGLNYAFTLLSLWIGQISGLGIGGMPHWVLFLAIALAAQFGLRTRPR